MTFQKKYGAPFSFFRYICQSKYNQLTLSHFFLTGHFPDKQNPTRKQTAGHVSTCRHPVSCRTLRAVNDRDSFSSLGGIDTYQKSSRKYTNEAHMDGNSEQISNMVCVLMNYDVKYCATLQNWPFGMSFLLL